MRVSRKTEFRFRKFKQQFEKEEKRALTMSEVLEKLMDKVETMEKIKTNKPRKISKSLKVSRHISAAKKYELQQKHHGKCADPNCNKPSTELHHPDRFALTRSHQNIRPLCRTHHQMAHSGLINENNSHMLEVARTRASAMVGTKAGKRASSGSGSGAEAVSGLGVVAGAMSMKEEHKKIIPSINAIDRKVLQFWKGT